MSTRWYPLYQKGNPQLRVFLPNFWMKLVRPENEQPPNVVLFKVSMEMSEHDVENYLREIYKVPVVGVRCRIQMGEFYMCPFKRYVKKRNDDKFAYVHMVRHRTKFNYNSHINSITFLVHSPRRLNLSFRPCLRTRSRKKISTKKRLTRWIKNTKITSIRAKIALDCRAGSPFR